MASQEFSKVLETGLEPDVIEDVVKDIKAGTTPAYSLEALVFMITKERVIDLQNKVKSELDALKKRQDQVRFLHQLTRLINSRTDAKGNFDATSAAEIQTMLHRAEEMGVEIPKDDKGNFKWKYAKEDKDRLTENIRMTWEDLNFHNDLQIQEITRLTNERSETYQMARSIMRPLHEAKMNTVREIGRKNG